MNAMMFVVAAILLAPTEPTETKPIRFPFGFTPATTRSEVVKQVAENRNNCFGLAREEAERDPKVMQCMDSCKRQCKDAHCKCGTMCMGTGECDKQPELKCSAVESGGSECHVHARSDEKLPPAITVEIGVFKNDMVSFTFTTDDETGVMSSAELSSLGYRDCKKMGMAYSALVQFVKLRYGGPTTTVTPGPRFGSLECRDYASDLSSLRISNGAWTVETHTDYSYSAYNITMTIRNVENEKKRTGALRKEFNTKTQDALNKL